MVDSLVFPTLAFGGFLPLVTLGQFAVEGVGGAVWSVLLRKVRNSCAIGQGGIATNRKTW